MERVGLDYPIIVLNRTVLPEPFLPIIPYIFPFSKLMLIRSSAMTSLAENMGIIIENPGFLSRYTGYKNLEYLASIRKLIGREQIRESMERVGLDPDSRSASVSNTPVSPHRSADISALS